MPDEYSGPFAHWRESLSPADRDRFDALVSALDEAGAPDPADWAFSEVSEGIPQSARFAFSRGAWRGLAQWRDPRFVASEIGDLAPGIEAGTLTRIAARVAYQSTLDMIMLLDDEEDTEATTELPGWRLMELDGNAEVTGRAIQGLHEDFLTVDPLGIEAEDIRGW